jgi:hypothetical protein
MPSLGVGVPLEHVPGPTDAADDDEFDGDDDV